MSRLTRNILSNLLGQGAVLALGFAAVKFIFRDLGGDALGILLFTQTLSAVVGLVLDLGIGATVVREVAAHREAEPGYIRDLIRTASAITWWAWLVLGAAVVGLAPFLVAHWVRLDGMHAERAAHAVAVLGAAAFLSLPRSLYASLFRGLQRMEIPNGIDIAQAALQQLAAIVVVRSGGGLRDVVVVYAAGYVLGIAAYVIAAARFFSAGALVPIVSADVIRRNGRFAAHMGVISVLTGVHTQTANAVASRLIPLGPFGMYTSVYGALARSSLIAGAVSQASFPVFSELFKKGDHDGMTATYGKLQDFLSHVLVPLFAAVPFAAISLFAILFNAETAPTLLVPATLLAAGFYMNGTLVLPYIFSVATGRPDITVRVNAMALVVVVPATVLLIQKLGVTGAALSWVGYHVFLLACFVPRVCRECLRMPVAAWYGHWLRCVALAGATYGTAWGVLALRGRTSGMPAVIAWAAATAVYALASWRMIGTELRETLTGLLQRLRRDAA